MWEKEKKSYLGCAWADRRTDKNRSPDESPQLSDVVRNVCDEERNDGEDDRAREKRIGPPEVVAAHASHGVQSMQEPIVGGDHDNARYDESKDELCAGPACEEIKVGA